VRRLPSISAAIGGTAPPMGEDRVRCAQQHRKIGDRSALIGWTIMIGAPIHGRWRTDQHAQLRQHSRLAAINGSLVFAERLASLGGRRRSSGWSTGMAAGGSTGGHGFAVMQRWLGGSTQQARSVDSVSAIHRGWPTSSTAIPKQRNEFYGHPQATAVNRFHFLSFGLIFILLSVDLLTFPGGS
jgi:hypothetical protein